MIVASTINEIPKANTLKMRAFVVFGCVSKGVKVLFSYFIAMKGTSTLIIDVKMAARIKTRIGQGSELLR